MYRHLGVVCLAFCLSFACGESPSFEQTHQALDPLFCTEDADCDDSNVCTDDSCVDELCVFVKNDTPNCCWTHAACGPGGPWDDGLPTTIDYCQNNQCMHVLPLPGPCDGDPWDCLPDDDPCTETECVETYCMHLLIPGCCVEDDDCHDGITCTTDVCVLGDGDSGTCLYEEIPGCCNDETDCDDDYPCSLDLCINHKCQNPADLEFTDCCVADDECVDGFDCTTEFCDLQVNACVVSLVPDQEPACCWTHAQCDDDNSYTIDLCVDHQCDNNQNPDLCNPELGVMCDDNNPCTVGTCDDGVCDYYLINGCCSQDADCSVAPLTDDNPCTTDHCNLDTHQCEFEIIVNCCSSSADCGLGGMWDDGDWCTIDTCVNFVCMHVKDFAAEPYCDCWSNWQCDDNNECTIDTCDLSTTTCEHTADLAQDYCCNSATDCYDDDANTSDKCVNYKCEYDCLDGCDNPPWWWCDDGNPCTCDMCIGCYCYNLGPDEAPPSCDLPDTCCLTDSDCPPSGAECDVPVCNPDTFLCEYAWSGTCPYSLPYTQNFNLCATLESLNWQIIDFWADTAANWKCTSLGPLGADNHLRFDWTPEINAPFESYLVTPPFDTEGLSNITVQFDRYYSHFEGAVELGLVVIYDLDEDNELTFTDLFLTVWSELAESSLPAATVHHVVSSDLLANWTYIGFRVTATDSFNLNHFDLDNVKVCPGVPPAWDFSPVSLAGSWDTVWVEELLASDGDGDDLEFILVNAPVFASLQAPLKNWADGSWSVELVVEPQSSDDAGEYEIVVRVSDGCLHKDVTIPLTVVPDVTGAYVVWAPPEVAPEVLGPVYQALSASGEEIKVLTNLALLESLSEVEGLFVILGVYGQNHVLTQTEGQMLADYLDGGGRLYIEGGDTWAYDPWTDVHHYFQVKGLSDGGQTYPGPVDGKHFCYGSNFNVALWPPVNAFIDELAPKLNGGAFPLLSDDWFTGTDLAISYEDGDLGYRTIAASLPLAALVEMGQGTVDLLVLRYLDFFEDGYPGCAVDEECDDGVICTLDQCQDGACEHDMYPDCIVCEDDLDCPEKEACVLSNGICVDIPGYRFDSTDTPIVIPAAGPGVYASTINIPGTNLIQDVYVQVRVAHTYPGDLRVILSHAGMTVTLEQVQPGLKGDGIFLTYDKGVDTWSGSVFELDAYDGMSINGDWTLTVTDVMGLHGGKLLQWSLYFPFGGGCSSDATCQASASGCADGWCTDEGYCEYKLKDCDDYNACTTDWCEEPMDCINQAKDCDDGKVCTVDTCDLWTGECINDMPDNCLGPCEGHDDCGLNDYCDVDLGLCAPIPGNVFVSQDSFPLAIPDADPSGLSSGIVVWDYAFVWNLYVKVMITHGYSSDLVVTGTNGAKLLTLHDQSGGMSDDVYRVYGIAELPDGGGDMDLFDYMWASGQWTLTVTDLVPGDVGSLDDWRLFLP